MAGGLSHNGPISGMQCGVATNTVGMAIINPVSILSRWVKARLSLSGDIVFTFPRRSSGPDDTGYRAAKVNCNQD
jgi:hypothetical protein